VALFVKANRSVPEDFFDAEASGLLALASFHILRVPGQVWSGRVGGRAILVMDAVDEGSPGPDSFSDFGRQLAEHHQASSRFEFGFHSDNYLGTTPQRNDWSTDWVDFFRRRRLGYQLRLARDSGRSTPELERLGDLLLEELGEWLDLADEPGCLLHGDLWSGNLLVDRAGRAVVIDPAVHFGHRECDLAMAQLFGGFPPSFYDAYREFWPLPPKGAERLSIYQLYHQLNHLNLFGQGYLAGCLATLRRLVG
jgi:fructosamine-3-kinase